MVRETIGKIPNFSSDVSPEETAEVKEVSTEVGEKEKETPGPPAEKPTGESSEDTPEEEGQEKIEKVLKALQTERVKLLKEISELKGQRREIKQEKLAYTEKQIDDLKDLHPDDVSIIERVLRSKGYVTKEESHKMFYEAVKQEELDIFLNKYPEYKPENDQGDINWSSLQREIGLYKLPDNPHQVGEILERAHREVSKGRGGENLSVRRRQVEIASSGSGGVQTSSSRKMLDPHKRLILERGGWSEEEIRSIESKLPE